MTPFHRSLFALGLCSLAVTGTAFASDSPDPSGLPACQMGMAADACRMDLKNGQFDALDGWTRIGMPSIGHEASGNPYAALHVGAVLSQAVYAHFDTPSERVAYTLRFRVRADRHVGAIRAELSMSDAAGAHAIPLGETRLMAGAGEWSTVEMTVNGAAFAAPAHVLVEIANEGGEYLQVDDVQLVQSEGAESLRRR